MRAVLALLFLAAAPALAQTPIPPGLTLPIRLNHELKAGSTHPGAPIDASTTQRILLPNHAYLPAGTHVLGHVLTSTPATASTPATLTLRFDTLREPTGTTPILNQAVAAANFSAVSDTAIPTSGVIDRTNSDASNWTTTQVGGEQLARSDWYGTLSSPAMRPVGFADYDGVYATPTDPAATPHALGVFSSTASGLYGYDPGTTLTSHAGDITLTAPTRLVLHGLDNLLLQVLPPATPSA